MFEQTITPEAKNSLVALGQSGLLKDSYLAGGTALALILGHRISFDFDFFTQKHFQPQELVEEIVKIIPSFSLERIEKDTILAKLGDTKFSLFFYNYPLLAKTAEFLNVNIASIQDLAAMKLVAISDRGAKRDFVDLYFILEKNQNPKISLLEVFDFYDKKFGVLRQNEAHLIKSLTYFESAEHDEDLKMLKPVDWSAVKKFFEKEAKKLV